MLEMVPVGVADFKQSFSIGVTNKSRHTVAGCVVKSGKFVSPSLVGIYRKGKLVAEAHVKELRSFKTQVTTVDRDQECAIMLDEFEDFEEGDELHCLEEREVVASGDWLRGVVAEVQNRGHSDLLSRVRFGPKN